MTRTIRMNIAPGNYLHPHFVAIMVFAILLLVCMTIICVVASSLIVVIVYILYDFIYWRVVENNRDIEIESDLEEGVERRRRRRQRKYCRVMMELPCVEYGSVGLETTSRECAICLEDYNGGEPCRIMPVCKHMFHIACIDNWLSVKITCPVCRQRIFNLRNDR
ncbi:unnamed protein product [Linum trigynum]|uniref:RING-type E3 ubiquitin transferase n=1 Tax=Linum trigynum TaxID=586398 RepID=A0AAV2CML8_9ROSI